MERNLIQMNPVEARMWEFDWGFVSHPEQILYWLALVGIPLLTGMLFGMLLNWLNSRKQCTHCLRKSSRTVQVKFDKGYRTICLDCWQRHLYKTKDLGPSDS